MEFVLDRIDLQFDQTEIVDRYLYRHRDDNGPILRFVFSSDTTLTMGILARLKLVPGFVDYIKNHIINEIAMLGDEDFNRVSREINKQFQVHPNKITSRANVMKLKYGTITSSREDRRYDLTLTNIIEDYTQPIETRADLAQAAFRMSTQSLRK